MDAKQFLEAQIAEHLETPLKIQHDNILKLYLDKQLFDAGSHMLANISVALYEDGQAQSFIAAKNTYNVITMSKFADLIKLAAGIALKWQAYVEECSLHNVSKRDVAMTAAMKVYVETGFNWLNALREYRTFYNDFLSSRTLILLKIDDEFPIHTCEQASNSDSDDSEYWAWEDEQPDDSRNPDDEWEIRPDYGR